MIPLVICGFVLAIVGAFLLGFACRGQANRHVGQLFDQGWGGD